MSTTAQQLADLVHGRIAGDGTLLISRARTLSEAQPGDITFVENDKHVHQLKDCQASAFVVPESLKIDGRTLIQVADPLNAFIAIVRHLHGRAEPPPHGVDAKASVDPSATLGHNVSLLPFAVVGEGSTIGDGCRIYSGVVIGRHCRLGEDVILYPNVVLYDNTVIGNRVIVHANAVLGGDGFGYRVHNGRHIKVPQLGHVEIADDVEIGACTTIDRGTFGATRIGEGTKIDNLVQIGHNCQIGRHNLLVSQVGIAGSSSTGDYVVAAGQAGIVDHVHIGDRAIIGAQAGVTKNVPPGECVLGAPATPVREQKRMLMSLEKLPDIRRDVRHIKQRLGMNDEAA